MSMVTNTRTSMNFGCAPLAQVIGSGAPYAFVETVTELEDARADWRELYAQAPASPYQAFEFVSKWFETLGRDQKLEPMIIVARDANRRALALLPLALEQHGPLRIGTFLCGRDSNFNLGLFRCGVDFSEAAITRLLKEGTAAARRQPDLLYLRNQPLRFAGAANPLVIATSRSSASSAYGAALPNDVKALEARFSKDTRKKLRKKQARLAEMGELRYEHRANSPLAMEIVRKLIEQKSKQLLSGQGVSGFDNAPLYSFLGRLSSNCAEGVFELHALILSGKIIATYAGVTRGGRFSAMLNSYDADDQIARCSPGDLLLHALLHHLVERGFTHFDLGAGEARYKNSVCDEKIDLYDTILPISVKGALAAPALSGLLLIKKKIKHTPWMTRVLVTARQLRLTLTSEK
jgi:CelD/BcsL family acetyltransferase involved in cellulose biosynthesis